MMKRLFLFLTTFVLTFFSHAQFINQPSDIEVCDDDTDGFAIFNLTSVEAEVLDNQDPTAFAITYHEILSDANGGINSIPNPLSHVNVANPQTMYIRVLEVATGNYETTSFDLIVNPLPVAINPTPLVVCDTDNDGIAEFDLSTKIDEISNGQPEVEVTFYETLLDAEMGNNAIVSSSYFNVVLTPQTIYVRVESINSGCATVVDLELIVDNECSPVEELVIQNGTFTTCGGVFTDSGGLNSNYSNDEDFTITICPETIGNIVVLNFTSFSSQLNYDIMTIYDGDTTNADVIGTYSGINSPNLVAPSTTNTSGCLTVQFISNSIGNTTGWAAEILCTTPCQTITPSIDNISPSFDNDGVVSTLLNETINFNGGATFSEDNLNATYLWDFGDGNIGSGSSVSYQYSQIGSYSVTLTVKDDNIIGCEESVSLLVEVLDPIITINSSMYPASSFSLPELITNVMLPEDVSTNILSSQVNGNPSDLETKNYGYFNRGYAQNFPFEEGIVLSTGYAYTGGNVTSSTLASINNNQPGDSDLETALNVTNTNDAVSINFYFTPTTDEISFRYLMASEEYDGSTECNFADSFAFLFREVGATEYTNLAVLPNGTPVNVTNVNNSMNCSNNPDFFEGYNIGNTNYGGRTEVLTAFASVIPNTMYEIKLVVADQNDSIWDTAVFLEANSFDLGNVNDNLGLISVEAFVDSNSDGIFNDNENNFAYGSFTYEKNNDGITHVVNTSNGEFSIVSTDENDTYDISFTIDNELGNCYAETVTSVNDVNVLFGEFVGVDFPVVEDGNCEDLAVYIINDWTPPRPGFTNENHLYLENVGFTTIASGTVEFILDPQLVFNNTFDVNPAYTITSTATGFTVDFVNLQPGDVESIGISITCPASVALNELVTNTAVYLTDSNDLVAGNNYSELSEVVVGSWDPNDKTESHGPRIVYDDFVASDEYLYYTIRFQNLGTAAAEFVRIEDELDLQLDETTFQMLRSSHDYVVTRTGNSLEWYFDNIYLPAEQYDAEDSNGYVYFKIKPKAGYTVGDIIPNTASIYFDYNAPVITNTYTTEFVETLSVSNYESNSFVMYPNPADNKVAVLFNHVLNENSVIELYDVQGKSISVVKTFNSNEVELDVSSLKSGLYFIKFSDADTFITKKLIVE